MIISSYFRKHFDDTFEEQLIKLPLQNINKLINWDSNREPDEQKIKEIMQSIENNKHSIQVIHCFEEENKYTIIDGGHRVEAYKKMILTNPQKIQEYLSDSLIISLIISAPIEYVVSRFNEINKATPLPELYKIPFEKSTEQLRKLVPEAIKKFKTVYKCFKTTNRPHLPNYNPASLTNDLFDVLQNDIDWENSNQPITIVLIMSVFAVINTNYKSNLLKNPSTIRNGVNVVNKAQLVDCFIFLKDWKKDFSNIYNRISTDKLIEL